MEQEKLFENSDFSDSLIIVTTMDWKCTPQSTLVDKDLHYLSISSLILSLSFPTK